MGAGGEKPPTTRLDLNTPVHNSRLPLYLKEVIYFTYTYTCKEEIMHKKLTISIDEQVYDGLYAVVGKGAISQFIEDLLRPHVIKDELDAAYKLMAEDQEREKEALAWAEALVGDSAK